MATLTPLISAWSNPFWPRQPRVTGAMAVWAGWWFVALLSALLAPQAMAADSYCARVKIEIAQELTLERQAFDAHMAINNGLETIVLENVRIVVNFADEKQNPVLATSDPNDTSAAFFIRVDSMTGISDISGSGQVQPASTADIHWLIVPAPGSGGELSSGKLYFVGATLSYTLGGEEKVTDVTPDFIYVKPMPLLTLDYFLTRDVYADDAFTPEIEPAEPFTLGVRVINNGHGTAHNVQIDSAQPRIVENELGLLIDFRIIGSSVGDQPGSASLLVDLGDIAPAGTAVARWLMETTLSGTFTEFTARFSHSDELGGELTSLLEATRAHLLVHDVLADLPGRDTVRDFLADDGDVLRLYESSGLDTAVTDQSGSSVLVAEGQSGSLSRYSLSAPATSGFMYVRLPDPNAGAKAITQVLRSDGKTIPGANAWLSKTRVSGSTWEYFINLFDANSSGQYNIAMETTADTPQPPVLQYIPDMRTAEGQQLAFIVEASDPNGTVPTITAAPLPAGATFSNETTGSVATYVFDWRPAVGQAGDYVITFTASDGALSVRQDVQIQVCPIYDPNCEGVFDVSLPIGTIDDTGYGWGYGTNAHEEGLVSLFESDGLDRLLHVQGFDIDQADEVGVYLNDILLGYLSVGPSDQLNTQSLWWLPASLQVEGENRVEFRQKSPGEIWGVTRLGLFAPGAAFGRLDTLSDGDQEHGSGFELHLQGSASGYLLGVTDYDADDGAEIALELRDTPLVDLPAGANDGWGEGYQLLLGPERLVAGDNRVRVFDRRGAAETWGLRLDGLRGFGAELGHLEWLPEDERHSDKMSLLVPPQQTASVLDFRCYDTDSNAEVALRLDGVEAGFCLPSDDNAWGNAQRVSLGAESRQVLVFDSTLNPPATDPWGVRLLAREIDSDGDTVADGADNCPNNLNPDQADLDGDGLGDACDTDVDGDGVENAADAFPLDPTEWLDTDRDGIGNNADPDDDNDGVLDEDDLDPLDPAVGGVLLSLTKTDAPDPVRVGSKLTYTIDYANDGTSKVPATNVVLTEDYDPKVTFDSASPMPSDGDNVWALGDLAPGASGTITVTVDVASGLSAGAGLLNEVTLSSDQAEASATQTTVVESQPVLSLTKTDTDPVSAGSEFVYTLTYGNDAAANKTATNVVLTETYAPNTSFVSANPAPNQGDNVWYLGQLLPGASGQVTITMRAASPLPNGTQITNRAGLSSDEGASASAEEVTTIQSSPVLYLAKTDSPDPAMPGEMLTYELSYGNGSSANAVATNVVLRETYDPNVTYVSADPQPDPGTINEWTLPDLSPGDAGTVRIAMQVNSPLTDGTLLSNTAVIKADQGTASAAASTVVNSTAELLIEAADDPDPVQVGEELTYSIAYGNDGAATEAATGVLLRLTYDPDVSLISADPAPDEGMIDQWTLGDLLPGEGGTVSVLVRVEGGSLLTTRAVIESDRAAASAEVTTTVESSYSDRFATREIRVAGTVSGTYLDTHALDGVSETIVERSSTGGSAKRYSYLEHKWVIDVEPAASLILHATVAASVSADGDTFELAYSTDDQSYTPMLVVRGTGSPQDVVYALPSGLSGPLFVRVRDTNRTPGTGGALDAFGVDVMYVRAQSQATTPPNPPSALAAQAVSTSQINLSWSDNSNDEDGFYVERYGVANWEFIGTLGTDVTTYQDTGLAANTLFRYRVLAYNGSGVSVPSNEAEATTLQVPPPPILLDASTRKQKAVYYVDLRWSGAVGTNVEVWRDGRSLGTTPNDGAHTDVLGKKVNPSYVYKVCEPGTDVCSNEVVVNF